MKRLLSVLSLIIIASVIVSACGGPAEPEEEPTAEPTEAEVAEEPTEAEDEETEEAEDEETEEAPDEGAADQIGDGELIKIATQSPLSGPVASIGTGLRNGAALALDQLGTDLTDMGFELELVDFDDEAQPERGVANANNAVADTDVLCVVGHLNSGVTLAALPTYEEASLVTITPSGTNPGITEGGFDVSYRVVGRDDLQGPFGAQFAIEELGIESAYIVHDQTDYGQGVAQFLRDSLEENDVEVLGFEGTQETANFDSILTPIQAANPDLLYFGGIYSQAGPLFRQARDRGIEAQFMGPDALDSPQLVELAGDAVEGTYYTTIAAPVSQFPDAAQFAEDYNEEYGEDAPPFSPQSYDSMGLCVQAIADAAEEVGGKPTREDVLEAMQNLEPYEGITGTYEFNEEGDPIEAAYYAFEVNTENWDENELALRLLLGPPEDDGAAAEGEMTEEEAPEEGAEEGEMTEEEAPEEGAEEGEMTEEEAPEEGAEEGEAMVEPVGDGELIRIATQSPLSGPQAALGTGIRNGAALAIDQLGTDLTDLGFELELADFDDEAQPERGVANANNIVADTDILCLVGHYNTGVALAALPTYNEASLVMVSPANTGPGITESGFDVAHRIVGRDDLQGPFGAQFAVEELGIQSAYVLHDQTDYGQGVAQFLRDSLEEQGATILGFEGTQETANFDSILTPIQAANPDLIYFGGIYSQAGPFLRQARDRGIEAQFLGPDGLDSPQLAELAGDAAEGSYYTTVAAPVSQFPDAAQYAEDYQAEYGEEAPPFSPQAYDSMGICIQAVADAAQEVGGKPTREDVLTAMENLEPYEGITGTYEFNEEGDPMEASYYAFEVNTENWDANELALRLLLAPPEDDE
jgi:ABC-type branched-subunit amino acid transport system substrate-binding protein